MDQFSEVLIVVGYGIQILLGIVGLIWICNYLLKEMERPTSEPDRFELLVMRHAPPWLRRILSKDLYADETTILAVLVAASVFGGGVWLIGLLA